MHTLYLTEPCQSTCRIRTNCSFLVHLLCQTYGTYITHSTCPADSTITAVRNDLPAESSPIRSVHTPASSYRITCDGMDFTTASPLPAIADILYERRNYDPSVFALHGAAVEYNNQAFLFLAATGSGKTTLTGFLTHKGFGYIADDCILLDRESLVIYPYTTPLHLRCGGLTVLKGYGIHPEPLEFLEDASFERYIYTPRNRITAPVPLGKIFFPTHNASENRIEEMNRTERMTALLKSPIVEYQVDRPYLQFIARLSAIPCYRLYYSDMDYVKEVLQNGT